jgi:hypothetical protein
LWEDYGTSFTNPQENIPHFRDVLASSIPIISPTVPGIEIKALSAEVFDNFGVLSPGSSPNAIFKAPSSQVYSARIGIRPPRMYPPDNRAAISPTTPLPLEKKISPFAAP